MFCEQCGAKLEEGIRFCENCGTPVPAENYKENSDSKSAFSFFQFDTQNWKSEYQSFVNQNSFEKGIIVTNLNRLCGQLNCAQNQLLEKIIFYAKSRFEKGIYYSFLDMQNQNVVSSDSSNVENVVSVLKKICEVSKPKYIFILGNEDVIGVSEWKNESGDSDETVTSDLSYQTLNLCSPWNGHKYIFDKVLRVGRLPSYDGESFEKFVSYFKTDKNADFSDLKTYGLSALVWKNESDYEYKNISSLQTDSAPNVTIENVEKQISPESNVLFFNLHGSDQTKYWYGQEDFSYPEAFEPKNIDAISKPFVLGVEACYGAKFCGNQNENESIVLKAMQDGCVSFLGSSKIAYGTSNPPGSCADFVVGEFLRQICNGKSAGDSQVLGIKRLYEETEDFSDSEIKTLAEFSLFGDPSQSIYQHKAKTSIFNRSSFASRFQSKVQGFHVDIPDIRQAVKLSLAQVDEKISAAINKYVYEKYSSLNGVVPNTYKVGEKDLFQSVYQSQNAKVKQTVKIYFDRNGKISKELESK